jgi:hypothetical protein
MPWDERIHAGSKTTTAKGIWKKRKGVDQALYEQVTAELKGGGNVPTPPPAPAATEEPATPPPPAPPAPTADKAPPAPPAPQAEVRYVLGDDSYTRDELIESGWTDDLIADLPEEAPAATPPSDSGMKFPVLMQKIKAAKDEGTLTDEQVTAVCQSHGMASIALVAAQPQLVETIYAELFGG